MNRAYSAEAVQQYGVEMALFAWALSGEGRRQSDNISTMWRGRCQQPSPN